MRKKRPNWLLGEYFKGYFDLYCLFKNMSHEIYVKELHYNTIALKTFSTAIDRSRTSHVFHTIELKNQTSVLLKGKNMWEEIQTEEKYIYLWISF